MNKEYLKNIYGLLEKGMKPPVFMSANTDAGDEANKAVLEAYKGRIPSL